MNNRSLMWLLVVLFAVACGGTDSDEGLSGDPASTGPNDVRPDMNDGVPSGPSDNDASNSDDGPPPAPELDLLRRWPEEDRLTHDADFELRRVLEPERLEGACERWEAGERDESTKLLCGKWMFFYETFGTVGIPTRLLLFAQEWYFDYYGHGFEKFGFVPDPSSPEGFPIGLAPTTGKVGTLETRAFTCASCHFGQMPDGRYAVGYGNMELDYGRFLAGLGAPLSLSMNENSPDVHESIREEVLPHVHSAKQEFGYLFSLAGTGIELLGAGTNASASVEDQAKFMALKPGTMDFLTEPLVDDGVWTVSRILSLWNIPTPEHRSEIGMEHAYLSWTGGATNLDSFISGFVAIGVADPGAWPPERIEPLKAYLQSLRTPPLESVLHEESVESGARIFAQVGCADCHNGPSGESLQAYGYDEIGTDDAMRQIFNPDESGVLCCGFDDGSSSYVVTDGIKAPRLTGLENQTRFLHNGSLDSLQQLLCLQERPVDSNFAQGTWGHIYGCDLSVDERDELVEYLRSL